MGINVVNGHGITPALQLFDGAVQRLDAVLDMVDRGVVIQPGKFLVQDLHLGHRHLQRTAVQVLDTHHAGGHFLHFRRQLFRDGNIPQFDAAAFFDHHRRAPSFLIVKDYTM